MKYAMCISKWKSYFENGIERNRFESTEDQEFEFESIEDAEKKLQQILDEFEFGQQDDDLWVDYAGRRNLWFRKEVIKDGYIHDYWLFVHIYEAA